MTMSSLPQMTHIGMCLGEVGPVGHGDDLALPVDDRADHVPDGRA